MIKYIKQCKVLHHGILKCESEPYMQYHHRWKKSGIGLVLCLPGKYIHLRCKMRDEVKRRIGIANSTLTSMNKVIISRSIDIAVRMRVLKCYIWSTLLYGCETWKIYGEMMKRLEALEIWFYRRMILISWKDRLINEEICRHMNNLYIIFV